MELRQSTAGHVQSPTHSLGEASVSRREETLPAVEFDDGGDPRLGSVHHISEELVRMAGEGPLLVFAAKLCREDLDYAASLDRPSRRRNHQGIDTGHRSLPHLTDRQRQIVDGLAGGSSERQVASTLGISEKTVQAHVARLKAKLNVESMFQLGAELTRTGLV
jgi:DNA-binding CsgD family transcriptional regulator